MFVTDGEERTIAPTPRRLADARRRGQFAQSRELTSAAVGCAAAASLWLLGPQLWDLCVGLFSAAWNDPAVTIDDAWVARTGAAARVRVAGLLAAMLGIPAAVAVLVNLLQQGFRLRFRMPPARGLLANQLAGRGGLRGGNWPFSVGQATIKVVAACAVTGLGVARVRDGLSIIHDVEAARIAGVIGQAAIECSLLLTSAFLAISVTDWLRQRRHFREVLRMTASELRDEARDAESPVRPRTNPPRTVSHSGTFRYGDVGGGNLTEVARAGDVGRVGGG